MATDKKPKGKLKRAREELLARQKELGRIKRLDDYKRYSVLLAEDLKAVDSVEKAETALKQQDLVSEYGADILSEELLGPLAKKKGVPEARREKLSPESMMEYLDMAYYKKNREWIDEMLEVEEMYEKEKVKRREKKVKRREEEVRRREKEMKRKERKKKRREKKRLARARRQRETIKDKTDEKGDGQNEKEGEKWRGMAS
jgi:hypothetical protein